MAKIDLRRADATPGQRAGTWRTAAEVLAELLRLLHPITPFVTEEIWGSLRASDPALAPNEPLLISARWPEPGERHSDVEADGDRLLELVRDLRDQRSNLGIPASAWLPATVMSANTAAHAILVRGRPYIEGLARLRPLGILEPDTAPELPPHASNAHLGTSWIAIEAASVGDEARSRRARREAELRTAIDRLRALLATEAFVGRAPSGVVERERDRLADLEGQLLRLGGRDAT